MATRAQQVIPVSQARTDISTILKSFTSSTSSEPVFIGAHRKAEAVLVPVSLWEEILDVFEDIEIGKIVLERASGISNRQPFDEIVKKLDLRKQVFI